MAEALHELPLAIFTTLASFGSGAFIALFFALLFGNYSEQETKRIDRLTLVPTIVVLLGFLASFFHLASPLHAIWVFSHLGTSPLSNELLPASVFAGLMVVYVALALIGKANSMVRKVLLLLLAVMSVVFCVFIGKAYMMPTILSWNTPGMMYAMVGYAFLGAAAFGALLVGGARAYEGAGRLYTIVLLACAVIGVVLALFGTFTHFSAAAGLETAFVSGAEIAAEMKSYLIVFAVLVVIAAFMSAYAALRKSSLLLPAFACVLTIAGIFCARLCFYALYISVGM